MVNHEYLEIFAELLKKDKKEIQAFKEAVYQKLAATGQDCRPNEQEIQENIGAFDNFFQQFLKGSLRSDLDQVLESNWLNEAVLEHLFFTKQHSLFAHTIHTILNSIAIALQDKVLSPALIHYITSDEDLDEDIDVSALFTPDLMPYLTFAGTQNLLGNIARANNVATDALVEFKKQVVENAERITKQPLEKGAKKLLEELEQAINDENKPSIKTHMFKLVVLSRIFFEDKNALEFAKIIFGISKVIAEFFDQQDLKVLQITLGLVASQMRELEIIARHKRLDLLCYAVLTDLAYDLDMELDYNTTAKEMSAFRTSVIQETSLLLTAEKHNPLLQAVETLNETAKRVFKEKNPSFRALQAIALEGENQLHHAFEHKEAKQFANIVKNIVDVLYFAKEAKQLGLFFTTFGIDVEIIAKISEALEKKELAALYKIFTDYALKEAISESAIERTHKRSKFNITNVQFYNAKHKEEDSFIEFQKAIYKELVLPTESDNLAKIIVANPYVYSVSDYITTIDKVTPLPEFYDAIKTSISTASFEHYKAHALMAKQHLKATFATDNPDEFVKIIHEMLSLLKMAFDLGRLDKVGELFVGLYPGPISALKTQKDFRIQNCGLVFYLLGKTSDPQYSSLLNFVLVDLLDFKQEFSGWDPDKQKAIAPFKKTVIEKLNHTNPIVILNPQEASAYIHMIQGNEHDADPTTLACFLNAHLRYWLLTYHNHPDQRRSKDGLRFMAQVLVTSIDEFQGSFRPKILDISRAFLNSGRVINSELIVQLLGSEARPLLAWLLLNSTGEFSLDNAAKQNGITLEKMNQFKTALGLILASKLGSDELLRDYPQLQPTLEIELKDELTPNHKQKLTVTLLETTSVLVEQIRTLDHIAFATTLTRFMASLKQHQRLLATLSGLLHPTTDEHFDLVCLVNHGHERLLPRYFIELMGKDLFCWYYNMPPASLHAFIKETLREIVVKTPVINELDLTSAETLEVVTQQNTDGQERNCLQLELGLQIRDAFYFDDPKQFATLVKNLTQLLQTLFVKGQHLALIQLLELKSENTDQHTYFKAPVRSYVLATKLCIEKVVQTLEAGNLNGLTKLLIDTFVNKCSENILGKTTDKTKFKQEVYDSLQIIPLDFYDPFSIDLESEKVFLVGSIRKLANQEGVNLELYKNIFEAFAKLKPIVMTLPKPEATDTDNYRKIYSRMHEIWQNHLLAHRFGITGSMLEGSFSITMMQELQSAFQAFATSPRKDAALLEAKALAFPDMPDDEWKKIPLQIKEDVSNILLNPKDAENPSKIKSDKTIAMPLFLNLHDEGHLTAVIFFKFRGQDYCIITDKSLVITKSSGLEIQKVKHPEQIPVAIAAIARVYVANALKSGITLSEFKSILQPLGLELTKTLPKKPQKSGNCGWSSSAKMSAFSLIFVNFLKGLETRVLLSIEDAMVLADKATRPLYKAFTTEDREITLRNYFSYCEQEKVTPHTLMMAQIFLKNEHHPKRGAIVALINTKIKITEDDKIAARKALLASSIDFLLYKSKIKDPLKVEHDFVEKLAQKVLDAYLTHQPEVLFGALMSETIAALQSGRELKKDDDSDEDTLSSAVTSFNTTSFNTRPMVFSSDATGVLDLKAKKSNVETETQVVEHQQQLTVKEKFELYH